MGKDISRFRKVHLPAFGFRLYVATTVKNVLSVVWRVHLSLTEGHNVPRIVSWKPEETE